MADPAHQPRSTERVEPSTRERIAEAANRLFEAHGFEGTSVRAIATEASIDAAQVVRHFGSKELLFVHVVGGDAQYSPALEGGIEGMGRRLVAQLLAPEHERMRAMVTALVRASDRDGVRTALQDTFHRVIVEQLVAVLPGDQARLRAELISAQLGGLVQAWSIIRDPHLLEAQASDVVARYGDALQALIDDPSTISSGRPGPS